jgi:hypothetical protein
MRSVLVGSVSGLIVVIALTGIAHAGAVAPEMDPGGALTAIGLLAGLAALAADRGGLR